MTGREHFKRAIDQSPLSMIEVAIKSTLSRNYIYTIIEGAATPSHPVCYRLADALGINRNTVVGWFWDKNGKKRPLTR